MSLAPLAAMPALPLAPAEGGVRASGRAVRRSRPVDGRVPGRASADMAAALPSERARCMPRPASDLGIVIDRSNAAAQTGVGFDSSRDVSLCCFDRCH
jgi:hypothetical protein